MSTRETLLVVPRSTEIVSAFMKVEFQTSTSRLAAKHCIAMDASLILPPESFLWEREGVAWAGHVQRALLTGSSLLVTRMSVIQEEV